MGLALITSSLIIYKLAGGMENFAPYLKSFVIASSWLATFPFFYAVGHLENKNYTYFDYSLIAPVWLGFWSMVSLWLARRMGWSSRVRFLVLSVITYFLSLGLVWWFDAYQYDQEGWNKYYLRLALRHFFLWNLVIYYIEAIL